jgi:hypothetical protein
VSLPGSAEINRHATSREVDGAPCWIEPQVLETHRLTRRVQIHRVGNGAASGRLLLRGPPGLHERSDRHVKRALGDHRKALTAIEQVEQTGLHHDRYPCRVRVDPADVAGGIVQAQLTIQPLLPVPLRVH